MKNLIVFIFMLFFFGAVGADTNNSQKIQGGYITADQFIPS